MRNPDYQIIGDVGEDAAVMAAVAELTAASTKGYDERFQSVNVPLSRNNSVEVALRAWPQAVFESFGVEVWVQKNLFQQEFHDHVAGYPGGVGVVHFNNVAPTLIYTGRGCPTAPNPSDLFITLSNQVVLTSPACWHARGPFKNSTDIRIVAYFFPHLK